MPKAPAPPYIPAEHHGGRGNKPINRIVMHATVSSCCDSAEAIARYFQNPSYVSSAHYIVDASETYQSVYDSYVAYHAPPNAHSLGVELCCTLSNEGRGHWDRRDHQRMLERAAGLVRGLCNAYDVPVRKIEPGQMRAGERGICGHDDVRDAWGETSHWDPGPHFPWNDFIDMVRASAGSHQEDDVSKQDVIDALDSREGKEAVRDAVRNMPIPTPHNEDNQEMFFQWVASQTHNRSGQAVAEGREDQTVHTEEIVTTLREISQRQDALEEQARDDRVNAASPERQEVMAALSALSAVVEQLRAEIRQEK